jgi:hypothetical protein
MDVAAIEHIIYAPVPYKGYSLRAKSKEANVDAFRNAFNDFLIPFDQSIIHKGFLEKVVIIAKNRIFLARVFQAEGLDELKRSGVVSHIAEIPIDLLSQNKLLVSSVDCQMAEFIDKNSVPTGEIATLEVPVGYQEDVELNAIRKLVPEDKTRRLLQHSENEKFRQFVISRNQNEFLTFGFARIISATTHKWILLASENIKRDLLFLYDGVLIIGKTLPPWARVKGWSIVNLEKAGPAAGESKPLEAVIKDIYQSKGTDENQQPSGT